MSKPASRTDVARQWWRALGPQQFENGHRTPGDRATLARLRRCSTSLEAAVEPATARLFRALALDARTDADLGRAAALAAILAHVRDDVRGHTIARAIGAPPGGEPNEALLKPNRFRVLVAARTDDEVLTAFRRVVVLLGRSANVQDLARLVLGWTDDEAGDQLRTRFAFDYHDAASYAPPAADETNSIEQDIA